MNTGGTGLRESPVVQLLLSPRDAAKALSISERTLWSLTRAGRLPCIRLGRLVRYGVASLREWLRRETEGEQTGANNGIDRATS